jgi:hypothetical protein
MLSELSSVEMQRISGGDKWEGSTGPTFPIPDEPEIIS